ncbi:MAG: LysM peptidoglycan-binding domain-containing protein [Bacteroidota bacterium]|nr:LysM peptidoglycan-binding domain-containing protein [Bacteroidota bacterium]
MRNHPFLKLFFFTLLVAFATSAFAQQEDPVKHPVRKGETIYGISRMYGITEEELIQANPQIQQGLKEGMVVIIPQKKEEVTPIDHDPALFLRHEVKPQETIYGLTREYGISEEDLLQANPILREGLKIGQVIYIPKNKVQDKTKLVQVEQEPGYIVREVVAGETIYSLSRAHGLTEEAFLVLNPAVKDDGLKVGMKVKLPIRNEVEKVDLQREVQVKPEEVIAKDNASNKDKGTDKYILYQLKPEDSVEGILAQFEVSRKDLYELNPELLEQVIPGRYIVLPRKGNMPIRKDSAKVTSPNYLKDLAKDSRALNVAVWLPFGTSDVDSVPGNGLNQISRMSLEFYTGLKLAFDTLATQGLSVNLQVEDTRNDLRRIEELVNTLPVETDLIIGPVYARNADRAADLLRAKGKLVISPLSKKVDVRNHDNLVGLIPDEDAEIDAMAQYINKRKLKTNIIFVNPDNEANRKKVQAIRQRLSATEDPRIFEGWIHSEFPPQGYFRNLLYPGKENVFVMVSEDAAFISQLTSRLNSLRDTSITLIGTSEALEIPTLDFNYLEKLHFTVTDPVYCDYNNEAVQDFIGKYRQLTKTEPGKFAFLGYDLGLFLGRTLVLKGGFTDITQTGSMEGLINEIKFHRAMGQGYRNTGVRILQLKDHELVRVY